MKPLLSVLFAFATVVIHARGIAPESSTSSTDPYPALVVPDVFIDRMAAIPKMLQSLLSESRPDAPDRTLSEDWLGVRAGWDAATIGYGSTSWPPPDSAGRYWKELHTVPGWPGMRVETDYKAVASAGRQRRPSGVPALAAMGILLWVTRRWA